MARKRRPPRGRRQSFGRIVDLWVDLFAKHNLLTYASAIAFQTFVALVALALLGIAVLGEIDRQDIWTKQIAPQIRPKVLPQVYDGIDATFEKVFHTSSLGLIAFAAALAIWEVSGAVRATMGALARVYGDEDDRPWWIRFPLSIALALGLTAAVVGALLLATIGRGAVGGDWAVPYTIVRWVIAIVLIGLAFGALVRFAPPKPRTTRWASAGATLVVAAWLVQTVIFEVYLRDLASYRSAAGSLLGVYFLTTYLYVGAIVLLVGIEIDELLRRDLQGEEQERGILELLRASFGTRG